ncbi:MAG TPA: hypothetical protein VK256_03840 [Candidatus Eisenbacteria bacterium]|nr:hypothetical protein [Candidatus Eisenbacteria bacterium]
MSPVQIWPSAPLGQRRTQTVVGAIGPVRGGHRQDQLDHLLLGEVLAKRD